MPDKDADEFLQAADANGDGKIDYYGRVFEPHCYKTNKMACARSEDSDQSLRCALNT